MKYLHFQLTYLVAKAKIETAQNDRDLMKQPARVHKITTRADGARPTVFLTADRTPRELWHDLYDDLCWHLTNGLTKGPQGQAAQILIAVDKLFLDPARFSRNPVCFYFIIFLFFSSRARSATGI